MDGQILRANFMKRTFWAAAAFLLLSSPVQAGPEEAFLQTAQIIYSSAADQPADAKRESYQQVRDLLDQIVEKYPGSETALRIILKDDLDGLDVAALDAALADAAAPAPQAASEAEASPQPALKPLPPLDLAPQAAAQAPALQPLPPLELQPVTPAPAPGQSLNLPPLFQDTAPDPSAAPTDSVVPTALASRDEKEIVKEVQAELNRLGCNAGTADGVAGRNTRTAFRNFIEDAGVALTEDDLATEAAVAVLKQQEGTICEIRTMSSTPASALAGSWGFRGDCPGLGNRVIRNSGRMSLRFTGNNTLRGTATNKQGISGDAVVQFQGSRTAATVIRLGFVTLRGNLTRSTRNMTISGTGTRNCKITLWKN
jgi:peptidoglycan hydrolase-like protein with peptidoglycan-binding domain